MIQVDIKDFVEYHTGIKVYPNIIPSNAELPAIMYRSTNYGRHTDSQLSKSDVVEEKIQFIVVSKTASEMITLSDTLITTFENFSGQVIDTNVLMSRVDNITELFNYTQNTHEKTVEIKFIIKRK